MKWTHNRLDIVRPGLFGMTVAADSRRMEFDAKNEILMYHQTPVDYVFIGDSITHMWELQAYFKHSGWFIANRGIGGDTTEYVLKRFEADVLQLKPKVVVIMIGINNTWGLDEWNEIVRKHPDDLYKEITWDIDQMLIHAIDANITPVLCSILPTCTTMSTTTAVRNETIVRINSELRQIANNRNAIFVDYHSKMTLPDGLAMREELVFDGIHPNVRGYNVMAQVLQETLNDLYDL
ncbi:hypothetical protein Back11_18530 [Paenibacillus baekrokdamisoli]|uniref:Uncharacterized protein n=1 Tax=Paenibacillus baekrokdamisoli TaxID=1712516 RepID=A0A3G9J9G3_9BACL|nr:GDSL-type esterase/lipase family protein [Paenibacillus baekrokdamisoli]MBB3072450.1 lysophospholipase L1-like esterase [Paenibacillus baekrokdamisoli]BBH20508.1 hypothetical protein Back11_18530 [Paenibacillus baekrokdamisoli]